MSVVVDRAEVRAPVTLALETISVATDDDARSLLARLSPSGALEGIAAAQSNPQLDELQDAAAAIDAHARRYLATPSLVSRLEDDFAMAVPAISDGANVLETWLIPILSALAGPAAPLVSIGLKIACAVALAVLKGWAARRLAAKPK